MMFNNCLTEQPIIIVIIYYSIVKEDNKFFRYSPMYHLACLFRIWIGQKLGKYNLVAKYQRIGLKIRVNNVKILTKSRNN